MIRILVVDDHPAMRVGLVAVLRGEPGLVPVGTAETAVQALEATRRCTPDVVLADYGLPDQDGATLTWQLRQLPDPPAVVIYSAFADPRLSLAAALSGAQAVLDKKRSPEAIFHTVRTVAGGVSCIEPLPVEAVRDMARLVDPQDQSIFGLALAGEDARDIASVLRMDEETVRRRLELMVDSLRPRRAGYRPVHP